MALIKKTKPLRVRLNCPYNESYIEFFRRRTAILSVSITKGTALHGIILSSRKIWQTLYMSSLVWGTQ